MHIAAGVDDHSQTLRVKDVQGACRFAVARRRGEWGTG